MSYRCHYSPKPRDKISIVHQRNCYVLKQAYLVINDHRKTKWGVLQTLRYVRFYVKMSLWIEYRNENIMPSSQGDIENAILLPAHWYASWLSCVAAGLWRKSKPRHLGRNSADISWTFEHGEHCTKNSNMHTSILRKHYFWGVLLWYNVCSFENLGISLPHTLHRNWN